ncbi:UNKNOWN [Stylonychia lemnae]|uniref:DED domain-containing protein n=1 Tax=Stylonychia lemnae TaxID=5949 RepID=A0A077ZXJ4_STYLE|nr:UNKNOWN [Stylonychia lemnae]|eukprot:CDW73947.1 UNKNOWN [Stylonychia lemnae]
MNLSNKTDATALVQLLRNAAFLDHQDISSKLLEYLRHKLSNASNEELSYVFTSLVLLRSVDAKFFKHLEILTLRRAHSLEPSIIGKVISSYAYLCNQKKISLSTSFIKTFEYLIMNKLAELSPNEKIMTLIAFLKLQRLTQQTKAISNKMLLDLIDQIDEDIKDEKTEIKVSNLAEMYYQLLSHNILRSEINAQNIEDRLKNINKFKPKDVFDILTVTQNDSLIEHLMKFLELNINEFMPEEIIILINISSKLTSIKPEIVPMIESYVNSNLGDMANEELAKLYCTIHNKIGDLLTKDFKFKIQKLIDELFPKAQAKSLPYLLPLVKDQFNNKEIRESVQKILRQKDFSGQTYIMILGQLVEQQQDKLNEDLEFWVNIMQYVPLIGINSFDSYLKLKSSITFLDENIQELDFKDLLNFLEERYEKPFEKLENKDEEIKQIDQ